MSELEANITIPVDLTNPGQFFACCGLLEIADRLWPGAEGWFRARGFHLSCTGDLRTLLTCLIRDPPEQVLFRCGNLPVKPIIAPLVLTLDGGVGGRLILDYWTKIVFKSGTMQVVAARPWHMWAGQLTSQSIWLKLRDELRVLLAGNREAGVAPCPDAQLADLFRQVRPFKRRFGLDSTAAWNPQDVGFSPDAQDLDVESSPAIELLGAVGLQRFTPAVKDGAIRYKLWSIRASPAVASALASGTIPGAGPAYEFEIVYRGQNSAFGKARPVIGDSGNA